MNESLDQQTDRVVRQGVLACASSLVATLASGYDAVTSGDLQDLAEQAFELAAPVLDYEAAAIEAGWSRKRGRLGTLFYNKTGDRTNHCFVGWQDLCDSEGIEPYDREVFEHWIVTQDLADDLIAVGEKVDTDFADLCVWARTTTGQMIAADACIAEVAKLRDRRYREAMGEG